MGNLNMSKKIYFFVYHEFALRAHAALVKAPTRHRLARPLTLRRIFVRGT